MALADLLGLDSAPQASLGGPDLATVAGGLPQASMPQEHHGMFSGGFGVGSPLRNFIGALADALSVAGGGQPLYQQRLKEQRSRSAVSQYLGNIDPDLAGLLGSGLDSQSALGLYRLKHPEAGQAPDVVRELTAAGIDPSSDEGKAIIRQHVLGGGGSNDPSIIRVLGALGIDPHSPEGRRLVYGSVSPPGYLMTPPAEGGASGGSKGLPHASSPDEARKLPPGTRFLMPDGRVGTVPGGATVSAPSHDFR